MSLRKVLGATFVLVVSTAPSPAQSGFGSYSFSAVPPRWSGIYPGFYGGYFPGFYSNGFSMYGPPVPTYGPVPGVFGGSDQRLFTYDPSLYQRRYAYRPIAPAPPARINPASPLDNPTEETAPAPRPLTSVRRNGAAPVNVEIIVPEASAEVVIDGQATKQTGTNRRFQSPPLPAGKVFDYEVRARWQANGQTVVRARTVEVRAGQRLVVDLAKEE